MSALPNANGRKRSPASRRGVRQKTARHHLTTSPLGEISRQHHLAQTTWGDVKRRSAEPLPGHGSPAAPLAEEVHANSARDLAGLFAHELHQPIAALLSAAEACAKLARKRVRGGDFAEAIDLLIKQAEKAGRLVRVLGEFARGAPPTLSHVELQHIVNESVGALQRDFESKRITVIVDLMSRLPTVRVHPLLLSQVLSNLLRNAANAMAATPPSRRRLSIRAWTEQRQVNLVIEDRGHGWASTRPAKASRGHAVPSDRPRLGLGLGLGLSLCRAILHAQGGRLWHEDRPGGGTASYISLTPHGK